MMASVLPIKLLRPEAIVPSYGSDEAIGLDIYACESRVIEPGARCLVPTGIAMAIPYGYYGRVAPRSGLAVRNGIDVLAGVIDSDYRGEVVAVLVNHSDSRVVVGPGDRVAQLILERADRLNPRRLEANEELPASARGQSGFGSTGK